MEIEKRKQTEEALEEMRIHWQRLREQLAQVGLFVPIDPTTSTNNMNLSEELRCQLEVARFVSDSLGRGMAKAEVEMEMESMLETKNFEITRLSDRLHYYEAVNREMSQRNQEAIGRKESHPHSPTYPLSFLSFCINLISQTFVGSRGGTKREAEEKEEAEMDLGINCSNHYSWKRGIGMVLHPCIETIIIRSITKS